MSKIDLSQYETAFLLNPERYKKIEKILRQLTERRKC